MSTIQDSHAPNRRSTVDGYCDVSHVVRDHAAVGAVNYRGVLNFEGCIAARADATCEVGSTLRRRCVEFVASDVARDYETCTQGRDTGNDQRLDVCQGTDAVV